MSTAFLITEDEASIDLAGLYLAREGFRAHAAQDGQAALEVARRAPPDLILLDLTMLKVDGCEVGRRLRDDGATRANPVSMLTARTDDADNIVGLEPGAGDSVIKPFNPRELVARVKGIRRRVRVAPDARATVSAADLRVDPVRREVPAGEVLVALRGQEFKLRLSLGRQEGRVKTRDLLQQARGYDCVGESRTVDVHVVALREKLKGAPVQIQSVRGPGHKLVAVAARSGTRRTP